MKRVFSIGKKDLDGMGRRINKVIITIGLEQLYSGRLQFTISGQVRDTSTKGIKDLKTGGQILDEIVRWFPKSWVVKKVYTWWKKNHLNTLPAETITQKLVDNRVIRRWWVSVWFFVVIS